jgi:predicted  nucleic acid-binding Zn-ribbon protein
VSFLWAFDLVVTLQDEITENKRKLKIMNHQIDQLKEEIQTKEAALVNEQLEHQKVEKNRDKLKVSIQWAMSYANLV